MTTIPVTTPVIFLLGATTSGKSRIALQLQEKLPLEIISVDSAQVYRDMNIGTAKPDADTLRNIPHHLINRIDPTEAYSAARFRKEALDLITEITARNRVPLLCGGTMLYFKALEYGLNELPEADPVIRAEIDRDAEQQGWPALHQRLMKIDPVIAKQLKPNDAQRIQRALEVYALSGKTMSEHYQAAPQTPVLQHLLKLALVTDQRERLHQHIAHRFDHMLASGFEQEVVALRQRYPTLHLGMPSMRCVGYRQMWGYLNQEFDAATMREKAIAATRQLAKRQITWLRSMSHLEAVDCYAEDSADQVYCKAARFLSDIEQPLNSH